MDPGADAAALAVVRRATSLAPDAAAEALRAALVGHLGDPTIADAAARSPEREDGEGEPRALRSGVEN